MKVRKISLSLIAIAISILLIVSCSPEPAGRTGSLKVSLDAAGMKGIGSNISMVATEYKVLLMDEGEGVIESASTSESSYSWDSIPTGRYKIKAYAKNASGSAIGESGTASVVVYPGKISSCTLSIAELAGTGTFSIAIKGLDAFKEDTEFSIVFYKGIDGALGSFEGNEFDLSIGSDGVATASVSLPNGFYAFGLASTDDAGDISIIDTVRIVKDDEILVSYEYSYTGDGSISIENNILPTPSIAISASGNEFPIEITSEIENLSGGAAYVWYMDGEPMAGDGDDSLTITAESGITTGGHTFMLLVISESGIVWTSEPLEVMVPDSIRTIDLASIDLENGHEIVVGSDEQILLSNVNIADGVVLTKIGEESSKSVGYSIKGNGNSASNGFFTQTGDFMLSPDKNMNAYFNGSDLGAKDNLRLKIKKFKNIDDDFSMTKEEYPTVSGLVEEFYYVNFNSEEFKHLNPEEIVFIQTGKCHHSLILLPNIDNGLGYKQNTFDLSDYVDFGFGIYAYASSSFTTPENEYHVYVCSPQEISLNETVSLDNNYGAFKISGEGNYKITYSFSGISKDSLEYLATINPYLRYLDGTYADYAMVPELDYENNSLSYYLKDVDGEMIFDYLFVDAEYTSVYAELEIVSDEDVPNFYDLSSMPENGIEITATSTEGVLFIPYLNKNTKEKIVYNITPLNNSSINSNYTYYYGQSGKGNGSNFGFGNISGVTMIKYSNAIEGEALLSITSTSYVNPMLGETYIAFDYEVNGYINADGERVSQTTSSSSDFVLKSDRSFDDYGYIYFGGGSVFTTNYTFNSLTSGNNAGSVESGTYAHNVGNDLHDKAVNIRFIELWYEDGQAIKLNCRVELGKNDDIKIYNDVIFTVDVEASHKWEITDGVAKCSNCNEQRGVSTLFVYGGIDAIVDISGIRDYDTFVTLIIEEIGFYEKTPNGRQNFEAPEADFYAYLVPPTSDSNIIAEYLGNGHYDIKVVYSK